MMFSTDKISKVAMNLGVEPDDAQIILCVALKELSGNPAQLDGDPIRLSRKTRRKLRKIVPELFD